MVGIETEIYPSLEKIEKYIDVMKKGAKQLQTASTVGHKKDEEMLCTQMGLVIGEINKEIDMLRKKDIQDESINRVVNDKLARILVTAVKLSEKEMQ